MRKHQSFAAFLERLSATSANNPFSNASWTKAASRPGIGIATAIRSDEVPMLAFPFDLYKDDPNA